MKCDVLIVGAGIAGLYLARELSKAKLQVIVIDQSIIPGEPNFSTAGTLVSTVQKFLLPSNGIAGDIVSIGFGTRSNKPVWKIPHLKWCTLDFRKTKQLLAKEASDFGAKVLWGVKAISVKKNDELCVINTSIGDIECSYTVDGSGSSRILFQSTEERKKQSPCVGLEIIVDDTDNLLFKFRNTMFFYFDIILAPFGYAWVFYNGKNTYKVGICEVDIDLNRRLVSLNSRLQAFLFFLIKDHKLPIMEKHGNSIIVSKNTSCIQQGRILAIGDAAGMINPFSGEGIRHSLFSALFAFESIMEHLQKNIPLSSYKHKIRKYKNINWQITYLVKKALYGRNTNETQELYEKLIEYGKYLNADDINKLAVEYSLIPIIKGFPHNIPLIKSFLKTIF